jgi:hypothetical protein
LTPFTDWSTAAKNYGSDFSNKAFEKSPRTDEKMILNDALFLPVSSS